MSGTRDSDLGEWLAMALPDDQNSKGEYNLNDILTDKQART